MEKRRDADGFPGVINEEDEGERRSRPTASGETSFCLAFVDDRGIEGILSCVN